MGVEARREPVDPRVGSRAASGRTQDGPDGDPQPGRVRQAGEGVGGGPDRTRDGGGDRETLRTALERLVATEAFHASSTAHVEQTLTAILRDWQDIRTKPVAQQRRLLKKLVPDRIAVTPHVRGDRKWVDWHG
jgi:hypothetical protein